jgi:hypothetical protein
MRGKCTLLAAFAVTLFSVGLAVAAHAQDEPLNAMAVWHGDGQVYEIGEARVLFIGEYRGILFVEDGKGQLDAATMVCPGTIETNLEAGSKSGQGRCILTGPEGHKVFAKWNCSGNLIMCKGTFSFTGGTGKFQGITGDNEFMARTALIQLVRTGPAEGLREAAGLAIWPNLRYTLP